MGPPGAVAPALRRRARTPSRPAAGVHRAGHRVGARPSWPSSTTTTPAWARRPARQEQRFGAARGGRHVAAAERVLRPPVPRGVELHPRPRGAAAPRRGRGQDHVGQRLPPPRGLLALERAGSSSSPSPGSIRSRWRPWWAATRPSVYGFDLDALAPHRRPGRSPRRPTWPTPLASTGSPTRPCAVRPSPWPRPARPRTVLTARPDRRLDRSPTDRPERRHPMAQIRYGARTPAQLEDREVKATSVGAWSTSLTASYETDPERHRRRPAPAARRPPTSPWCGCRWPPSTSARVGRPSAPAPSRCAPATRDTVGYYPLVMPMTTEQSVIGGRETFGEPKKLGQVELVTRDGDAITGTVHPAGGHLRRDRGPGRRVRWIRRPTRSAPTSTSSSCRAPDGKGFDSDPSLVYCQRNDTTRAARAGRGRGRPARVPLRSGGRPAGAPPRRADLSEQKRSIQRGEIVARVPAADVIPFVHQRYDDLAPRSE